MDSARRSIPRIVQRTRDQVPLPATVGEMFDGPRIREEYNAHRPAVKALTRYQQRAAQAAMGMGRDGYKVPYGVRIALQSELFHVQIIHRHPWAVVWFAAGKRYYSRQVTLAAAVQLHRKLVVDHGVPPAKATIISRSRGYDIPPKLRGKLPAPWKWCPRCMKPRKFRIHPSGQEIEVQRKEWSNEKRRYVFKQRKVRLIHCPVCGTTNRDNVYRRSNQPWEIRKFKRGVRRAVPRHTTNLGKKRRRP